MTLHAEPTASAQPARLPLSRRAFRLLRRIGPAGPLAVAACVMPGIGALVLYQRLGAAAAWLRDHNHLGPVACAATFGLLGGVALLPTYALSLVCGWSFGFGPGLVTTLAGFLAAALLGYGLARNADQGRVMRVVEESPKLRALHTTFATGGVGKVVVTVGLVRLAPVAPFSLTNLAMAAMRIHPVPYAVGTLLGMAPRTALLVYAASRLSSVDAKPSEEPMHYIAGAVATVLATVALGWIGKKGLERSTENNPATA